MVFWGASGDFRSCVLCSTFGCIWGALGFWVFLSGFELLSCGVGFLGVFWVLWGWCVLDFGLDIGVFVVFGVIWAWCWGALRLAGVGFPCCVGFLGFGLGWVKGAILGVFWFVICFKLACWLEREFVGLCGFGYAWIAAAFSVVLILLRLVLLKFFIC